MRFHTFDHNWLTKCQVEVRIDCSKNIIYKNMIKNMISTTEFTLISTKSEIS